MASGPRNAGGTARTRAPLSCTIVCYDEEEGIRAALESVKWCDEIVVVDSFSTDRTVEICREYTDRIFQREWPGFVEQKALALEQTRCAWVLNLDADERVSPELRREIEGVLRSPDADGYTCRAWCTTSGAGGGAAVGTPITGSDSFGATGSCGAASTRTRR